MLPQKPEDFDTWSFKDRLAWARANHKGKGRTKLSDDDVAEIRRLYDKGDISQAALATAYKVTQATIGTLVHMQRRLPPMV